MLFFRWCSRSYYAEDGEIADNGSNHLESVQETDVNDTSASTSTSDDPFQKSKAPRLLDLLTTTTKMLEKNLSPNQRDQVVSNLEKDEMKLKQKLADGLTNATNEFNKALESISQSMVAGGKSTRNGLTLLAIDLSGVKTLTHSAETFLMIITVHSRK